MKGTSEAKNPLQLLSIVIPARDDGFGRAIVCGLDHMSGDAVVIMMADESDDCRDVVRYWEELNKGYDLSRGDCRKK